MSCLLTLILLLVLVRWLVGVPLPVWFGYLLLSTPVSWLGCAVCRIGATQADRFADHERRLRGIEHPDWSEAERYLSRLGTPKHGGTS